MWTHCAHAAPCVRSSPQCSLRPCRVPTEVSSGLLRHLMNVHAASPHFYTFAPASQSSPVAHNCAVLPVFALLTRAAAHVGLMYYLGAAHCSLEGHLQEQCGPFPGAASTWAVSLRSHTIRVLITALPGQRFATPRQLLSWNTFTTPGQPYTMPHQRQQCTPHWLWWWSTSFLDHPLCLPAPTVVAASGPTVLVHRFNAISYYGAAAPVAKCFSSASIACRTIPCSMVDRTCASCVTTPHQLQQCPPHRVFG